ncbi:MAG: hypothetical protein AAI978_00440 [Candidatus Hodgkinia cicadicola]
MKGFKRLYSRKFVKRMLCSNVQFAIGLSILILSCCLCYNSFVRASKRAYLAMSTHYD